MWLRDSAGHLHSLLRTPVAACPIWKNGKWIKWAGRKGLSTGACSIGPKKEGPCNTTFDGWFHVSPCTGLRDAQRAGKAFFPDESVRASLEEIGIWISRLSREDSSSPVPVGIIHSIEGLKEQEVRGRINLLFLLELGHSSSACGVRNPGSGTFRRGLHHQPPNSWTFGLGLNYTVGSASSPAHPQQRVELLTSVITGAHPCIKFPLVSISMGLPGGSVVKNPPANAGDARDIWSLSWEDPLGRK